MASCLGLYINDNIVKYAKMTMDNNKNITLENYGIRYIKESMKGVVNNIIEETNSSKDMIAINTQKDIFVNYTMFNQGGSRTFMADVAKMEFESWCEKNGKVPSKYSYVYKVADVVNSENKYNAVLNIMERDTINEFNNIGNTKLTNMYPVQFLMNRLVPQDESNYILVNMDDKLSISVVINDRIIDFKFYDFGMKDLIYKFSERLGSYQKAYEACKQLNVYSDEETNNDKKLEEIAEPILQEILKSVAVMVNKYRKEIDKVIISGHGIMFTNIDILFKEYLNVKCDILKPDFLKDTSNVRNLAEALETTQAMALALEVVSPRENILDYVKTGSKIKQKFDKLISKENKAQKVREKNKQQGSNLELHEEKLPVYIGCFAVILSLAIIGYITFSALYTYNVNKTLDEIAKEKKHIVEEKTKLSSDITYINNNTSEYSKINMKVQEVVEDIEKNNVSKYTTYNVAAFLQNILKVIPTNVKLQSISSDDNKNITIKATSNNYPALGYFISELKINGPLKNIQIKNIQNGTSTVVEIGGELP